MSVLIVEHDVGLVLDICDSVTVLAEGRVIARGTPVEVRSDPCVIEAYLGDEQEQPRGPRQPAVASTEVVLSAEGLDCGYGALAAARDVTLQVRRGEVVALLGPNGAGKTTTLLTLAGALEPLGGEVRLRGVPASGPLHRRARDGVALLTDDRAVLRSLSTSANLRLARADIDSAMTRFPELSGLLERRAGLLSGGEQQILSLARVLASDPELLLVDEMSQGLAPLVTARLLDAIRHAADQGIGVLLVEQHVYRALAVADRFYVMSRGRIVMEGSAEEYRGREHQLQDSYLASV